MTFVLYPGTFDPMTYGHCDLIQRATSLFDKIVVAVSENSLKKPLFSLEERVGLVKEVLAPFPQVEVISFSGLLVDLGKRLGISTVLRGIRTFGDFERESMLAATNHELWPEMETVFLMSSPQYHHLSSSLAREIASYGGDVSLCVPLSVAKVLGERFKKHS